MIPVSSRSAEDRSTAMARFCLEKRTTQSAAAHTEAAYTATASRITASSQNMAREEIFHLRLWVICQLRTTPL